MKVTYYKAPNGEQIDIEMTKILPEDEAWFRENNAKISMEELRGEFVVYADTGLVYDDGEPIEAIQIAAGRSCEETMSALREECEQLIENYR